MQVYIWIKKDAPALEQIQQIAPKAKREYFEPTQEYRIVLSERSFRKVIDRLRAVNINPYAVMQWAEK